MTAPASQPESTRAEPSSAFSNALKMVAQIVVTWGIALGVRLVLPRVLGPERFGELNWADAAAGVAFLSMAFGIDTWIRKEVGITLPNANSFFGGVLVLRLAMTVALDLGAVLVVRWMGRSTEVQWTLMVFGVAQLFTHTNNALAALLHSKGRVDGLLVSSIVSKLVWGAMILAAVLLKAPLPWLALAMAVSEGIKVLATWRLAMKHAQLKFEFDLPATVQMLKGSLPFYVNALALGTTGRLDTAILGTLVSDTEVGWYGAVLGIFGLVLVLSPLMSWLLMPMLARAAARSADELDQLTRRALEATLAFAMPIAMLVGLGAELFITILYGQKFAPAALPLRIIAPAFVLTYLNIVSSICLTALNRGWSVTITSVMSVVLSPVLNLALIPLLAAWLGPGGGAAACCLSLVLSESITTSIMLYRIGRRAIDARIVSMVVKTLMVCAGCIALEVGLRHVGLAHPLRLAIEALVYVVGVLGSRAVNLRELAALVKTARARRAAA